MNESPTAQQLAHNDQVLADINNRIDGRCRTPEEIGYICDDYGVYRAPMTAERRQQLAEIRASRSLREPQTDENPPAVPAPTNGVPEAAETAPR